MHKGILDPEGFSAPQASVLVLIYEVVLHLPEITYPQLEAVPESIVILIIPLKEMPGHRQFFHLHDDVRYAATEVVPEVEVHGGINDGDIKNV